MSAGLRTFGRRVVHSWAWMVGHAMFSRACLLGVQLVLAALLSPSDFGSIGLAYTVTVLASTLNNAGMEEAVLQRRNALRYWAGTAFWINLVVAFCEALLVLLISPIAAAAYGASDLVGMLAILAFSMPIVALSKVPEYLLRAHMQFRVIAICGAWEIVGLALLTIGCALAGFGAYSFVIPVPVLAAVKAAVFWHLAPTAISLQPQLRRWKHLAYNTSYVFVTRTLVSVISQGDYMILGLLGSQHAVGIYYFGFRLAVQPLSVLATNFRGVLFPILVQLKSDPQRQADATYRASILLSFCVMPIALLQAAVAGPLIENFFGQKWTASIPIIQILSIGLAFDAVSAAAGALLNARGHFKTILQFMTLQTPIFFAFITIGGALGQEVGVAWGVCAYYALTQPLFVIRTYARIGVTPWQVAAIYLQPTAYASIAAGLGLEISGHPIFVDHLLIRAAVIGAVGAATYLALVRWGAPAVWEQTRARLVSAVGGRLRSAGS